LTNSIGNTMADEVVDRRTQIEAAFEQQEQAEPEVTPAPAADPPPAPAPTTPEPEPSFQAAPAVKAKADITPAPSPESPTFPVDKAPQSWRAPSREKWAKIDPDIQQEIMKRERETTRVLGETAHARQLANNFSQMINPYMARIQTFGIEPMAAIGELLKADYLLSSAPKAQRAAYMAKLINDYGVDIAELDSALAGKGAADPVDSRVEQLLQQRLAPFQQYLQAQQQREQQYEQRSQAEVNESIENMATDPKFPHFESVRLDMADIVDLAAKRGLYLSLEDAYNRAIAMNPEVSAQVAAQRQADAKRAAAQAANAKAQKALGASISVGGAPGGVPSGASEATDRRSTIAAAFDSLSGR
jgi:hypothetical protein